MSMSADIISHASKSLATIALFFISLQSSGCAPSRAKMVREQRNTTIGLLGASYRPNGNIGVGVAAGASKDNVEIDREKKSYATKSTDDIDTRKMAETSSTVSPFVHYYPWETSAFFTGVGANIIKRTYSFDEEKDGSTTLAPSYTEVQYNVSATELHAPLGWNWIWENGITLMLDFGPSMTVAYSGKYADDGSGNGVNSGARDQSVSALDRAKRGGLRFAGASLIGYSF